MHKAIRTQADDLGDVVSLETGLTTQHLPDRARQEFRDEADINQLLNRYGVGAPTQIPVYGETDFDLDLQQSYTAIRAAEQAWKRMPLTLRERYPTWQTLLTAVQSGQLQLDITNDRPKKVTPDPVVPPEPQPGVT